MEIETSTTHIGALTEGTPVWSFDGILCHTMACPVAIGTDQSEFTTPPIFPWGQHFFPAGCCIEVDVISYGEMEAVTEHLSGNGGQGTPIPKRDPIETEDFEPLTEADVVELIKAKGGKFDPSDMTPALVAFAQEWLAEYDGDFEFLLDVRSKTAKRGLSAGQAKGVCNCIRASYNRGEFGDKPAKAAAPETGLDLTSLHSAFYAIPGDESRLKIRVNAPTKGKWVGWVFVDDGAAYGYANKYGSQKPGAFYRGDIAEKLAIIVADPEAALKAYGDITGKCGHCNRQLEDETSVERGVGPICWVKYGHAG